MKDLNIKYWGINLLNLVSEVKKEHRLFGLFLLLWFSIPKLISGIDQTAGFVDQGIWQLVLLALISFLLMVGLCWWLLKSFWLSMGLPRLDEIFMEFNGLDIWEQLRFVLGLFALLLLAGVGCLIAVL